MRQGDVHSDRIILEAMAFYGYHGVNPEERKVGQSFTVDLQVYGDFRVAGRSDNLEDTLDYSELYRLTKDVVEGEPHNLLEWVAETIAQRILESFKVTAVAVRVTKPSPPITGATLKGVAVEVYREGPAKG
ncbi:MAG: dihydroneopterin aldolase [Chloroflexi bacterium]|nr:dihydroneopterin aldolase [Chloroflexota bacterium]MCZ6789144.1 dihydroneopterin aldolase [Chloroflexota bacterium]MCZ6892030.1 dihydroneopterin aldolase [Chloroflexota bacterium]